MLDRNKIIQGRPYVRLSFKADINPFTSADDLRNRLTNALKSSPHFLLVGEPERAVSSAYFSPTSLGFGTMYVDATVRYLASVDGMTYDVTLRPYDVAVRETWGLGNALVTLRDAGIIGDTLSAQAPVGMKSAQELAKDAKSPVTAAVDALGKPLATTATTINYLSWAVIAGAVAFVAWKGEPIIKGLGKAFKRG